MTIFYIFHTLFKYFKLKTIIEILFKFLYSNEPYLVYLFLYFF